MEQFFKNATTRIYAISSGHGIPLILCNGGPGCDDYLGPVAAMLEDMCRVIRFEPRGCGRSDWDQRYDLETTVEDVEFIRRACEFPKVIVGGHSAGVDVALAYAIKYPANLLGLIGISGGRVVDDREWSRIYHDNLESRGEDAGGKIFNADPEVNKMGNKSWRQFIKRPTLLRELANIAVPAVFINGGGDIRPNWPTMQLASLLPRGRYVEIAEAEHYVWLSHGDALRAELRAAVRMIAGA